MASIRLLSEDLIGKIAAGEVVERPASALKELIENSLDAGASAVSVEIREGGAEYFRVTDNGCGIDPSDIRMAFERHATSKISSEKDLNAIGTLGFRGEALASIAAVSKVTMTTRTENEETGIRVLNAGGQIQSIEETACPVGTTITVRDLFYNVPVRKGFLKKAVTEANAVSELIQHMILSRPDVSFRYVSNGKTVYHSAGDGDLASALNCIYGVQALKNMRKVSGHSNGAIIDGYVGIGENARGNRGGENFFINGRVMRSNILSLALEAACKERVMIGKYPTCAIHIQVPYDFVDVNVHPNKLVVRFQNDNAVKDALFFAVRDALQERDAFEKPTEMTLDEPQKKEPVINDQTTGKIILPERKTIIETGSIVPPIASDIGKHAEYIPSPVLKESKPDENGDFDTRALDQQKYQIVTLPRPEKNEIQLSDTALHAEQVNTILPNLPKPMKIFGALFDTYILIEYHDHLLMIDQHAVHERLLYEKMMKMYEKQHVGQEMLIPVIISVTRKERSILEENRNVLESIGLIFEDFGENDIAIRSTPMVLGKNETEEYIGEILDELENGKFPGYEKKRASILQMACKHAVKGGEPLSEGDLRHLVEEMIDQQITPTCPHGRPLVVAITHREIDKKFKRIQ